MAYSDFTFDSALQAFGLGFNEYTNLFPQVVERAPRQELLTLFEDHIPLGLAIGTEKARSEFIIAPLLAEARRQANRTVSCFSGIKFDVAPELGLTGYCDFILSRSPEMYSLKAPVLMLVEAKQEYIPGGFGPRPSSGTASAVLKGVSLKVKRTQAALAGLPFGTRIVGTLMTIEPLGPGGTTT